MADLPPLDKSFSPSYFIPDVASPDQAIQKWVEFQEKCFRQNLEKHSADFDVSYGPEFYDIWYPKNPNLASTCEMPKLKAIQHIHVFIHGGYWQECSRKTYGSVLNSFLTSGIAVVMLGYTLATEVPLSTLVAQVEEAIKNISSRFPHAKLTLSGHSAGAHLAAKAIENPEIGKLVRSAVLICGVYDLVPLIETYIGRGINLTKEMAEQMSVDCNKVADFKGKLLCISVNHDAPALTNQFKEFVAGLSTKKKNDVQIEYFDEDHFSVISSLDDPASKVSKSITQFVLSS